LISACTQSRDKNKKTQALSVSYFLTVSIEGVNDGWTTQRVTGREKRFSLLRVTCMMLCQCWIGYHRFEAINIAKLLKFDAASCPRIMETTLPKPKSSQSFSSTTRSDCWIDAVSILRAMEAFIVGFMWLNYELTACLWISVRGALHCAHLQCAWCYALCLPTVCYLRAV